MVFNASPAAAATYEVKMGANNGMLAFEPSTIKAKPGDTIDFVNNKLPPHNVVFDKSKSPSSEIASKLSHEGLLYSPGQDFKVTIPEDAPTGSYEFYCQPHRGAGMVGKIVVE
ncbi:plastocyanin [Lyngbya aestuarii BL J]|uniref:Plastocyanin n=1 Tax=Lyngbya aestuarii BL J TaxID=1348334 RepID=U7QIU9_9CYAN|nr:plastocyanin [Lyngbya aestuarii BL J]